MGNLDKGGLRRYSWAAGAPQVETTSELPQEDMMLVSLRYEYTQLSSLISRVCVASSQAVLASIKSPVYRGIFAINLDVEVA